MGKGGLGILQKLRRWLSSLSLGETLQIVTIIVAIVPGVIALLTLHEMQTERNNAMRPDVVLEADSILYYYEQIADENDLYNSKSTGFDWTDELDRISTFCKCDSTEAHQEIVWKIGASVDEYGGFTPFRAINIGIGTAKNVNISIERSDLDSVYENLNDNFFAPYYLSKLEGEWSDDIYPEVPDDYYSANFEYLQTAGSDTNSASKPLGFDGLTQIASFLLRVADQDERKAALDDNAIEGAPYHQLLNHRDLTLIVSFEDIQGVSYSKKYALDIGYSCALQRVEGTSMFGILTCFKYDIEPE